jgi:hypothetical protein
MFALLPSGAQVRCDFLRNLNDPMLFAELFGVRPETVDMHPLTKRLLLDGYAQSAIDTTLAIRKMMTS